MKRSRLLLVTAALLAIGGKAMAHGFEVAIVAPFSGSDAAIGRDVQDGFLMATAEADGHAFEESDGHLGGMDSYIVPVDGAAPESLGPAELPAVQILVVVAFAAVDDLPKGAPLVLIDADPRNPSEAADALRAPELEPAVRDAFAARYEQRFGEAPSRYAFEGYRAARLIDRAIRIVGADLSNQQELRAAFEAAARQP